MSKKIFVVVSVALLVAACAQKPAYEEPMVDPVSTDMPDPNGKL